MSADQDQVFQEDNDQRQRTEMSSEQDKFLAELALKHFLWLASHGMTTVPDVVKAKEAFRALGVNL